MYIAYEHGICLAHGVVYMDVVCGCDWCVYVLMCMVGGYGYGVVCVCMRPRGSP